jgi:hypothetical protein
VGVEGDDYIIYKQVSFAGHCAYKFTGGTLSSRLQQNANTSGVTAGVGLAMSVQVTAKNMQINAGTYVVKVKYTDNTKQKFTLTFDGGTYPYTVYTLVTDALANTPINKIKAQVVYSGTAGKLTVDQVSLTQEVNKATSALIPLP